MFVGDVWTKVVKSVQWQLGGHGVSELRLCFGGGRVRGGETGVASREQARGWLHRVSDTYMSSKAIKDKRRMYTAEGKAMPGLRVP